jgi:hypothetical protein
MKVALTPRRSRAGSRDPIEIDAQRSTDLRPPADRTTARALPSPPPNRCHDRRSDGARPRGLRRGKTVPSRDVRGSGCPPGPAAECRQSGSTFRFFCRGGGPLRSRRYNCVGGARTPMRSYGRLGNTASRSPQKNCPLDIREAIRRAFALSGLVDRSYVTGLLFSPAADCPGQPRSA